MVGSNCSGSVASYPDTNQELYGSGLCKKQERSENDEDDSWRNSKVAKTDEELSNCNSSVSLLRSNSSCMFPNQFQQSFTSSKSTFQSAELPYFQPAAAYTGNSSKGEYNGFTASQWMELEQQALIYKYIRANIPIPSHLLLPIRKAFESVALSGLSAGLLRPSNTLGWGAFHLGFSTSTDPEPGRCRRTDGKKWRCSKETVADQKYCERHINRGRHRSRKPVEGQQGPVRSHFSAAAAKTAHITKTTNSTAAGPNSGKGNSGANNSSASSHHQLKTSQPIFLNRICLNKVHNEELHDSNSLSIPSSASMDWQEPEKNWTLTSEEWCPFKETANNKFGFVTSDPSCNLSLSNPSPFMHLAIQETEETYHPFIESWLNPSDMTHMSLSSELLSHEPDFLQMGFGVSDDSPMDWQNPIGGSLGEALQDSQTSPRCVLQKTTFPSLSYSSAGSSPGATNLIVVHEGFSCELNTVSHSSSLPA